MRSNRHQALRRAARKGQVPLDHFAKFAVRERHLPLFLRDEEQHHYGSDEYKLAVGDLDAASEEDVCACRQESDIRRHEREPAGYEQPAAYLREDIFHGVPRLVWLGCFLWFAVFCEGRRRPRHLISLPIKDVNGRGVTRGHKLNARDFVFVKEAD